MDKLHTENLIRKLRETLKRVGLTLSQFSEKYIIDNADYDPNEDEVQRGKNKIKKQLQRTTTNPEIINSYIRYLEGTEEYSKAAIPATGVAYKQLTGDINDYSTIVRETSDQKKRSVIEVAAAYAYAVGAAWSFQVVPLYSDTFESRYLVLWEGDIGHNGGSGSWGPAMCEVVENRFGKCFIQSAEHHFETSLRCVARVINYVSDILYLVGYRYDSNDVNNRPSRVYKVAMRKNKTGKWEVINEQFLGKRDQFIDL